MTQNLSLENYVSIIENNSLLFSPTDIVNICKRKNNSKRDFLFVNSLQGKHLHVNPCKSFSMFNELTLQIKKSVSESEKVIVIGFAETATAIAHYVASTLPNCVYYMQTTREVVDSAPLLLEFKEEHSHATEQLLYGEKSELLGCDRIIFIDDEISTGNTVLNFINEIEKLGIQPKFSVASILNWQNDEWSEKFKSLNIDCFYLLRGKLKSLDAKVDIPDSSDDSYYEKVYSYPELIILKNRLSKLSIERIGNKPIPLSAFKDLVYNGLTPCITHVLPKKNESVLVIGTEEYMYTPMVFASVLSELGAYVQFHATTRSPIETSKLSSYTIKSRYPIASCYDKERNTFIYNLQKYDKVFIVTDVVPNNDFVIDISSSLNNVGCDVENITIIVLKG